MGLFLTMRMMTNAGQNGQNKRQNLILVVSSARFWPSLLWSSRSLSELKGMVDKLSPNSSSLSRVAPRSSFRIDWACFLFFIMVDA
ncbi:hypothetical protein BpHYR1_027002 [Brachionus plicatilis]|uniref:Uncharacterized protein n=1 Tax=Brachionus plicatilis TaxID=10195 RepID=A0A3M7SQ67_BRAPC|nr:hypothetical protein BpHYR1_027002 [Brachionus plicatilis]